MKTVFEPLSAEPKELKTLNEKANNSIGEMQKKLTELDLVGEISIKSSLIHCLLVLSQVLDLILLFLLLLY